MSNTYFPECVIRIWIISDSICQHQECWLRRLDYDKAITSQIKYSDLNGQWCLTASDYVVVFKLMDVLNILAALQPNCNVLCKEPPL